MNGLLGNISDMIVAGTGFTLSTIDVIIIIGSLVAVVIIGLVVGRRQGESARSYFLASGNLRWWLVGMGFVATSVSSEQIVGTVGAAFGAGGMGIANWEWCYLPVYTLVIIFFVPLYLKNRVMTLPSLLSKRFGPLCADIYSWVMLFAYVCIFTPPVLYGGSLAFSELTGWNQYIILWTTVVFVGAYCTMGGLRSVVWTDALQCVLLIGGGIVLFLIALGKIDGGWMAMERAAPERFHLYKPPSDPETPFLGFMFATVGVWLFYQSTNQFMIQRVLAARSTWDGKMGIVFAAFINIVRPVVACFMGLIVYHWIYELKMADPLSNNDLAWPFALKTFAPAWGLRGLILAGFLAAIMSTISTLGNSTATIFSLDVYKKVINKNANDRQLVFVGRLAMVGCLVGAALLAPLVRQKGIFKYFQTGIAYLATPIVSVFLLGVFWRRANKQGAIFGLVGGLVITAITAFLLDGGLQIFGNVFGLKLHFYYVAAIAQAITMTGIVIVSLLTPPPTKEQWKPFTWTPALLGRGGEADASLKPRPWYQSLWLWWGLFAAIWIAVYVRFW